MENITCYSIEPGTGLFRSRNLAQCQRKIKGILAFICSELFMRTTCTLSTCLSINYYKNLYLILTLYNKLYNFRTDCWMDNTKKHHWQKRHLWFRTERMISTILLTLVVLFRLNDVQWCNLCLYGVNMCHLPYWQFWKGFKLYYSLHYITVFFTVINWHELYFL